MDSTRLSELQDMSMPELWQIAVRLGVSRKGKKAKLIERILEAQAEHDIFQELKAKMTEFEKTKEELKTLLESVAKLGPKLGSTIGNEDLWFRSTDRADLARKAISSRGVDVWPTCAATSPCLPFKTYESSGLSSE